MNLEHEQERKITFVNRIWAAETSDGEKESKKIMSSHSGTIGRSKGVAVGGHIRRQRSVEWHHAPGYSSSDDDDRGIHGTINPSFDSQLLAQLIAQSQELSNKCKFKAAKREKKHVFSTKTVMPFGTFVGSNANSINSHAQRQPWWWWCVCFSSIDDAHEKCIFVSDIGTE